MADLRNDLCISVYIQCGKCMEEIPDDIAPRDYAHFNVGWTKEGLQVWCVRHDINVLNIDFEGCKHPADTYICDDPNGNKMFPKLDA